MDRYELVKATAAHALLSRDASENRVSHAYLLVSPDSATADILCSTFVGQLLFGSVSKENAERAARSGADIIRLPEGDKVLTADVEALLDTVYFTPTEHDRKFYIVDRAETMNDSAQNKILKVLEEPPSKVVIILKATSKNAFLPTVLSRVKLVEVEALPDSVLTEYLTERFGYSERTELAVALSGGYLGRAEEVMSGNRPEEIYRLALDTLKNMKNSRCMLGFSVRIMAYKDYISDFIDVLELLLADSMLVSVRALDSVRLKCAMDDLEVISAEYTDEVVVRLRPALLRARNRLKLNGNIQSVLDELLFSLLEVKAKCRK